MCYIDLIDRLFSVIFIFLALFYIHYMVIALIGVFTHKSYPHSEHRNRFGLIIPARNEEAVISTVVNSIRKTDYPQDLLDIFVFAHNLPEGKPKSTYSWPLITVVCSSEVEPLSLISSSSILVENEFAFFLNFFVYCL